MMALLLVLLFDLLLLSFLFHIHIYIQTDRQKDRQTDRQTRRHTDTQTDVSTYVEDTCLFNASIGNFRSIALDLLVLQKAISEGLNPRSNPRRSRSKLRHNSDWPLADCLLVSFPRTLLHVFVSQTLVQCGLSRGWCLQVPGLEQLLKNLLLV